MYQEFLYGAYKTLSLACVGWIFGFPIGILLSFFSLRYSKYRFYLSTLSVGFTVVPFLAVLYWFHYPLQNILGVIWPPYFTSALLLSLFIAIISGEIIAEEMRKIKTLFVDSANVLGINSTIFIKRVIFPTSIRNSLPRLLNLAIVSIHMTMFSSLIGVEELFRVTLRINATELQPIKLFSIMAAVYALVCLPLYYIAFILNRKILKQKSA